MTKLALLSDPEVRVARLPGEIAVISLLGEHDVTTAWEVRNAIAFALAQGTLVVDLSETEFIDSSIVHALVDSVQLASAQGLRISLQLQTHASVKRMLESCSKSAGSKHCLFTEPAPRPSMPSGRRPTGVQLPESAVEPQQWKGGKGVVALGSNHLACPVRRHWRTRDHEVPLLRADRGSAPGVDRSLHTRNCLRRGATVPVLE